MGFVATHDEGERAMTTPKTNYARALVQLALLWAGALLAASAWAAGLREEGLLLDADAWRREVAGAPSADWPVDGWYRLSLAERQVEVRRARPSDPDDTDPDNSFYVRVPGTRLKEGLRPKYRFSSLILQPAVGKQYELMLGRTPFSLAVESDGDGTHYRIGYGGETYHYPLGLPAAANVIHAVADLDADAMPDFLVEVGDELVLLLSTRAVPGTNVPSARLVAMDGC
jgi:hypothetical protein